MQADRRFGLGALIASPHVGVEWIDRTFIDYCYGVRAPAVRPGRRAYQRNTAANAETSLHFDYQVAPRQTIFLDVGAMRFCSAIMESPLVEQSDQNGVSLGYLYRF